MMFRGLPHYDSGGSVLTGPGGIFANGNTSGGLGGIADAVGGYVGKAVGATPAFTTDPNAYKLQNDQEWQTLGAQGAGAYGDTLDKQGQLGSMLLAQANGGGPNLATNQLQQATDANIKQAMALGASMPSYAGAGARLQGVQSNAANIQQQSANQAAQLRQQQQLGAQQQLQGLYGQEQSGGLGAAGLGLNAANAQLQAQIAQQQIASGSAENQANRGQSTVGGVVGGVGSALGLAGGGMVPRYAAGGGVGLGYFGMGQQAPTASSTPLFSLKPKTPSPSGDYGDITANQLNNYSNYTPMSASSLGALYATGGGVPGRASVDGNSPKNDTVPAMLSPGEVVLPRSVTEDEDAPHKAMMFVQEIMAKKYGKRAA